MEERGQRAGLPLFNMKHRESRTQGCPQVRNYFLTGNSTVFYWNFLLIFVPRFSLKPPEQHHQLLYCSFFFHASLKNITFVLSKLPPHPTRGGRVHLSLNTSAPSNSAESKEFQTFTRSLVPTYWAWNQEEGNTLGLLPKHAVCSFFSWSLSDPTADHLPLLIWLG